MTAVRSWVLHCAPRIAIAALAAAPCACGGGGAPASVPSTAPVTQATAVAQGTLLQAGWSAYPRLVRLQHQSDAARNGVIVASITEMDGRGRAGFHASFDGGGSFGRIGTLLDDAFTAGLCCGTLFEMPQAVGTIAAGTLLYAASVGADVPGALMQQLIFASVDGGATFRRLAGATCGRSSVPRGSAGGSGVWEPEFLIAADGSLACIFSDETEPGRSQVLKLTRTRDGTTWSTPELIVAGLDPADRPGMAVVRKLPSGDYAMSFERCTRAQLDCSVHLKMSPDGLHWGPLGTFGTRPQTAGGKYLRHAPTLAWTPVSGSPDGALALIGQIVADASDGVDAVANGRVLLVNRSIDATGHWSEVAAPIGLSSAPLTTNWCQNYSTPLLPSLDGSRLMMMQTDSTADGGCVAHFGVGDLPL